MTSSVSTLLLQYLLGCVVALVVAHVLVSRYNAAQHDARSPQRSLARLILLLNIPVLAGVLMVARVDGYQVAEIAPMLAFSAVVYNGIGYAYFHVFNMSETARRVRILLFLLTQPGMQVSSIQGGYSPRAMMTTRIERLEKMGQIVRGADGHLHVSNRMLLTAARLIGIWRAILGFAR